VDTEQTASKQQGPGPAGEPRGPELAPDLRAAQGGDVQAFDRLLRPQLGRLLALCRRLRPSEQAAEELLQEGLIRAHRGLASFRAEGSFRAWIVAILYRLASEPERIGPRPLPAGQSSLQSLAHEELPDSLSSDPAAQASARDVLRRVEAAMERLPLRQRSALHLRSVEGFDYAEIARVLETSEGAVRNAVMHARQKLRERLGDLL
jgi:RNA polymerase sigma-70 factor (ECF subfamily)